MPDSQEWNVNNLSLLPCENFEYDETPGECHVSRSTLWGLNRWLVPPTCILPKTSPSARPLYILFHPVQFPLQTQNGQQTKIIMKKKMEIKVPMKARSSGHCFFRFRSRAQGLNKYRRATSPINPSPNCSHDSSFEHKEYVQRE